MLTPTFSDGLSLSTKHTGALSTSHKHAFSVLYKSRLNQESTDIKDVLLAKFGGAEVPMGFQSRRQKFQIVIAEN